MYKQKMNKELKDYLYMLVGSILTPDDYRKILDYFNQLKQERDHYQNKTLNLQKRMVNAICYIENICLDEDNNYCWDLCGNDIFKVLDILKKGSDKDEKD